MKAYAGLAVAVALLLGGGNVAGAADARKKALEHYRQGDRARLQGNQPKAETELQAALAADDRMDIAHYSLGQLYMSQKRYPEAVQQFTGAVDAARYLVQNAVADKSMLEKRRQEEIEELRDSLRTVQSGQLKGMNVEQQSTLLERRIAELENQRDMGPGNTDIPAEYYLSLGSAQLRTGDMKSAEASFREAIRIRACFGEAHNNLAFVLMKREAVPEAVEHLDQAEKCGYQVNPQFRADLERMRPH